MKVSIGSLNPVKISAVEKAFQMRFKEKSFFCYHKVPSGISDQPYNDETRIGAVNRAKMTLKAAEQAEYGVGIEGGIEIRDDIAFVNAWCAIVDMEGNVNFGHSFGVPLPKVIMNKIKNEGMELGDAHDELVGETNTKQKEGWFGLATDNHVTREHGYINMVLAALTPIALPEYYKDK